MIVEPSDPGYAGIAVGDLAQLGAYVDLGYLTTPLGTISLGGPPSVPSGREDEWFGGSSTPPIDPTAVPGDTLTWTNNVWDTWTPEYESDGFDQDRNDINDQGTNGVNDGGSNVIDDPGERETIPPYTQPIRGLKVTLRLVEKGTKQVHQISIIHSFVPE